MPTSKNISNPAINEIDKQINHWKQISENALEVIEELIRAKNSLIKAESLSSNTHIYTFNFKKDVPANNGKMLKSTYDLIKESLSKTQRPLTSKEILTYVNQNGMPEKTDSQLSPQLSNAVTEKKIINKYKAGLNYYYALPSWFDNQKMKDKYAEKIKAAGGTNGSISF